MNCSNCKFFIQSFSHKELELGECRYNPPVLIFEEMQAGFWPVISKTDWCGKYEWDETNHCTCGIGDDVDAPKHKENCALYYPF